MGTASTPTEPVPEPVFRFSAQHQLRHTDTFGGSPFVHGGVMLALTEISLDVYDAEVGVPSHRDVLRMQTQTEVRYRQPLRWDDFATVSMRCSHIPAPGRLVFACEVRAGGSGALVAEITHRYAYLDTQTGRLSTPPDWPVIVAAIEAYEEHVVVEPGARTLPALSPPSAPSPPSTPPAAPEAPDQAPEQEPDGRPAGRAPEAAP